MKIYVTLKIFVLGLIFFTSCQVEHIEGEEFVGVWRSKKPIKISAYARPLHRTMICPWCVEPDSSVIAKELELTSKPKNSEFNKKEEIRGNKDTTNLVQSIEKIKILSEKLKENYKKKSKMTSDLYGDRSYYAYSNVVVYKIINGFEIRTLDANSKKEAITKEIFGGARPKVFKGVKLDSAIMHVTSGDMNIKLTKLNNEELLYQTDEISEILVRGK